MAEKKSLVEETLLQMKNLEDVISENAKGILHSTMKEEIGELVKESLKEAEEETDIDMEDETEMESDEEMAADTDMESDDEMGVDADMEADDEMEDETEMDDEDSVDLRGMSFREVADIISNMDDDDKIVVVKDEDEMNYDEDEEESDEEENESENVTESMYEMEDLDSEEDSDMGDMFSDSEDDFGSDVSIEDMDSEEDMEFPSIGSDDEYEFEDEDVEFEDVEDEDEFENEFEEGFGHKEMEDESPIYEIIMDDGEELEGGMSMMDDGEELEGGMSMMDEEDQFEEITTDDYADEKLEEGFKAKGVKGKGPKFSYKTSKGGFKEDKKEGPKMMGTGKPKFTYKKGENMEGKMKTVKKMETKEASRTLGSGRRFGRKGLPKPKAAPRHLNVESVNTEVKLLREKNEEYRKALNIFRTKLNEVAVFNSNLAYATRLFTEHSTTKQEKINILRRFDGVESLKESKSLYKTIKEELSSQNANKVVKESIQEKIERAPQSGSATNLIESKTYENPQFMRMKDLMSKMNIIK